MIIFNGNEYIISNETLKKGDLYINYSVYKGGIDDKDLKKVIGTVMEIGPCGTDTVIYAEEFKSDLLSSCKKLTMNNSISIIEKLNKTELRDLLIELRNIGNVDKPANVKKSEILSSLFNAENREYYTWSDKFTNIRNYVDTEILHRIIKNTW